MPEYSSTTITPADGVQLPAQNGATSGNFTLSALRSFILASKGQANGLAGLGPDGKLDPSQIPASLDDVLVYATRSNFPAAGTAGKIYIAADTNRPYRWDDALATPAYVELSVDLSDYATKAEVADAVEDLEAADTDLKNAITANTARIENLEQKAGGYSVVNYRGTNAVPSGKAKYAMVEKIVGKSRGWNQLIQNGNFATHSVWETYNCSYSVADNVATISATDSVAFIRQAFSLISGHKYLYRCDFKASNSSMQLRIANTDGGDDVMAQKNTSWQTLTTIWTSSITAPTNYPLPYANGLTSGDSFQVKNIILRDLTIIFGSGNEPSTVAEAVALCPSILEYDAYGYSMVDTVVEGVKSVGVNIWDEQWQTGSYNSSTGAIEPSSTSICSSNKIAIKPNTQYYGLFPRGSMNGIWFYDINGAYMGFDYAQGLSNSGSFTSPANAYFVAFQMNSTYGTSYTSDIQICLNSYTDKTTYHPYMTDTLSLSSPVTLRSAGSVADTLDVESGEKTNPIGVVDLGTLNWSRSTSYSHPIFYTGDLNGLFDYTDINGCCALFEYAGYGSGAAYFGNNALDKQFTFNDVDGEQIYFRDDAYPTATAFKTAMNGVYLYYKKKTPDAPTQLEPILDPMIATEGGGTISTMQTQTPVIDNCLDVGYLAV